MKLRAVAATLLSVQLIAAAAPAATMRLEPDPADAVAALQAAKVSKSPGGEAVLQCATNAEGVLGGCSLISESISGQHLGEAALALAPLYRASAPGSVRVTVAFKSFEGAKWRERPDALLFMRALRRAGIQNPKGTAKLDCLVGVDGLLVSCRVIASAPTPQYGQAGMMVASNFRYRPATYGGVPVPSRAVIPLDFRMG